MPKFRMLVLSDLHMHRLAPTAATAPSVLSCNPLYSGPRQNPIEGAADFLKQNGMTPDIIACPGDLADGSDVLIQEKAWEQLELLRKKVHARRLIGTVGNHDVDSRRSNPSNLPDASLRILTPGFPLNDRKLADKFWNKQYTVLKVPRADVTIVIINSSSFHGISSVKDQEAEYLHGKLTESSLNSLAEEIKECMSSVNILMMHHHVRQHPWLKDDISHVVNGSKALDLLRDTGVQWLVLHGHQHLPSIGYSEGGSLSPIVLSAGSVAARTYAVRGKTPRNQMYCVEFDTERTGLSLKGKVFSWDWIPFTGWQRATRESGLPRECGFGFRDIDGATHRILQHIQAAPDRRASWADACAAVPEAGFLVPDDLDAVIGQLEQSKVEVAYDRWLVPSQLQLM